MQNADFAASPWQESAYTQNTVIPLVAPTRNGKTMANKVIDEDFAKRLLAGERLEQPKTQSQPKREVIAQFADSYKPDPTKKPQAGYPQEGDKGDIWAQWKKQGRKGAAELVDRWGA